jgi:hypothetical protein
MDSSLAQRRTEKGHPRNPHHLPAPAMPDDPPPISTEDSNWPVAGKVPDRVAAMLVGQDKQTWRSGEKGSLPLVLTKNDERNLRSRSIVQISNQSLKNPDISRWGVIHCSDKFGRSRRYGPEQSTSHALAGGSSSDQDVTARRSKRADRCLFARCGLFLLLQA